MGPRCGYPDLSVARRFRFVFLELSERRPPHHPPGALSLGAALELETPKSKPAREEARNYLGAFD